MNKPKYRFAYLLVGIFIGGLIAFSIVWWKGNNTGEWKVLKKVKSYCSNIFERHNVKTLTIINENPTNTKSNKAKQNSTSSKLKNDSAYFDSTNVNLYDPNALDEFLAKYNGKLPDSLLIDSILKSQKNMDINSYSTINDADVKQDKLIFAKSFKVPGIDVFLGDNPDKLDSLLTDNKSNLQNKNKNVLRVEFWKSPINYKGYKTGKNKLVLFGVEQFNMISFKLLNNMLYMHYISDYYQIEKSDDFKSLTPVNNPQLLSQLNNK
jgi:hypothetical protein